MAEEKTIMIRVAGRQVGLHGLDEAAGAMAAEGGWAARDDEAIGAELMSRLAGRNYFAPVARDDYIRALAAHFRRAVGQEVAAADDGPLEVKVLGQGCSQCSRMYELCLDAAAELGLAADVEHVSDLRRIAAYGPLGSPALLINGKPLVVGRVPSKGRILQWMRDAQSAGGGRGRKG